MNMQRYLLKSCPLICSNDINIKVLTILVLIQLFKCAFCALSAAFDSNTDFYILKVVFVFENYSLSAKVMDLAIIDIIVIKCMNIEIDFISFNEAQRLGFVAPFF